MILDGEAVVLDGTGRSNFGMLQGRCAAVELAGLDILEAWIRSLPPIIR